MVIRPTENFLQGLEVGWVTFEGSQKVPKTMDFESLRGSVGNAGVQILLKAHIEHKSSWMATCYDKSLLLQGNPCILNTFQTLWSTPEAPHDRYEHLWSDHNARKWPQNHHISHQIAITSQIRIFDGISSIFAHFEALSSLDKCSYRPCGAFRVLHNVWNVFRIYGLHCNNRGLS